MVLPADAECHIFAVEIADNDTFSERLSDELREAYPELVEEITAEVAGLLGP
jgi:Ni,Fe-hydrogenase maturation factor